MQGNTHNRMLLRCIFRPLIIWLILIISPLLMAVLSPTTLFAASSESLPLADFMSSDFAGSGQCALCHSRLADESGNDVSIDSHWRSTMMANSAKDPLWRAKMSSEIARNPALREIIEDKCATCHTPMARTEAITTESPVALLDKGFFSSQHALHPAALDGVSCSLCHQIQDRHLGEKESFTGHYSIDNTTSPPDRLIFGPYPAPVERMMRNNVGFTPVEGPHFKDSALCGTCHTLYTPYVDAAGKVLGQFPEQTPYLEWEESEYADGKGKDKTCQDCHMPKAAGGVVISNRPPRNLSKRSPFGQHHFVGANTFMLTLFSAHRESLGVTASPDHIEGTAQRTLNQLQKKSAQLSIADAKIDGDALKIDIEVTNLAGHKFPTAFPSRRTWIYLTVQDASGTIIFESGRPRDDGSIEGNDAYDNPSRYEPHYTGISKPEEVQIYEAIMKNSDGKVTYTLLRSAEYAKDNRLLPRGFDKTKSPPDVAVYGTAGSDTNFTGGRDRIVFEVGIAGKTKPFTVSVQLLYQTLSYPFLRDLLHDTTAETDRLQSYYADADRKPVVAARIRHTVE